MATLSIAFWPDRGQPSNLQGQGLADGAKPVWIEVGPQVVVGSDQVAEVQVPVAETPSTAHGLRRMGTLEPSLSERARPWGLEESPSRLRFEEGPMRVAGGH